jgi:hypothetical protein
MNPAQLVLRFALRRRQYTVTTQHAVPLNLQCLVEQQIVRMGLDLSRFSGDS